MLKMLLLLKKSNKLFEGHLHKNHLKIKENIERIDNIMISKNKIQINHRRYL